MSSYHEFVLRSASSAMPVVFSKDPDVLANLEDSMLFIRGGILRLRFTRKAPTRADAIRTAIEDVRRAGIEAAEDTEAER